jgi:hypothetical protein
VLLMDYPPIPLPEEGATIRAACGGER